MGENNEENCHHRGTYPNKGGRVIEQRWEEEEVGDGGRGE